MRRRLELGFNRVLEELMREARASLDCRRMGGAPP
jgi:hypothetical protein